MRALGDHPAIPCFDGEGTPTTWSSYTPTFPSRAYLAPSLVHDILGEESGTGGQAREGTTSKARALIHQQPSQSPGPSERAGGAGQGT